MIAILLLAGALQAQAPADLALLPAPWRVELQLTDAPVQEALEAIATQTGTPVAVRGVAAETAIDLDLQEASYAAVLTALEEALDRRLVQRSLNRGARLQAADPFPRTLRSDADRVRVRLHDVRHIAQRSVAARSERIDLVLELDSQPGVEALEVAGIALEAPVSGWFARSPYHRGQEWEADPARLSPMGVEVLRLEAGYDRPALAEQAKALRASTLDLASRRWIVALDPPSEGVEAWEEVRGAFVVAVPQEELWVELTGDDLASGREVTVSGRSMRFEPAEFPAADRMRLTVVDGGGEGAMFTWPEIELLDSDGGRISSYGGSSGVRRSDDAWHAEKEIIVRGDPSWVETVRMRFLGGRSYVEVPFRFEPVPLP